MNLIVNSFFDTSQASIINDLVERFDFEYICFIFTSNKKITIVPPSKKTIVEQKVLLDMIFGNYDLKDCEPLDVSILEKMAPYEPIILKMMDRSEYVSYGKYSEYEERHALYLKQLRYWNHLIKEKEIDLYISLYVPHRVYDYIIYALCRVYNVPTLLMSQVQMIDTVIPIFDISNWGAILETEYELLTSRYELQNTENIQLHGTALQEWNLRKKDVIPFYVNNRDTFFRRVYSFLRDEIMLKNFSNPLRFFRLIMTVAMQGLKSKMLWCIYKFVARSPDYTKRYVYFPLHLQPEASTSPMGGYMVNQELAIAMLAQILPSGVYIYVKENPAQKYNCRNFGYYNAILKNFKNVIFVPLSANSHELSKNAIATATITGTAGWESLFKGKPVIVFGDCFYDSAPGVFKIRTLEDCRDAVNTIVQNRFKYDEKKLKIFVQSVSNCAINGSLDRDYFPFSSFTHTENDQKILVFLRKFLNEFTENKLIASNESIRGLCR